MPRFLSLISAVFLGNILFHLTARAEDIAQWIWREQKPQPSPAGEQAYLRHRFFLGSKVEKASLDAASAGTLDIFINGKPVGKASDATKPLKLDVTNLLEGWKENSIAISATAGANPIGLVAQLTLEYEYGKRQVISSNTDWKISLEKADGWQEDGFADANWAACVALGKLGDPPLGNVFPFASGATPGTDLQVPPGFAIELIRSASAREGSWICMTKDDRGRLYISPQNAIPESGFSKENDWGGIWRATLDDDGKVSRWEKVPVPIGDCMGMLWAFDSLYLSGKGPEGQAIYRCKDVNKDDVIEDWSLFKKIPGGNGEHGAHAILAGPDQQLYFLMGNGTPLAEIQGKGPYRNYAEDDVLPRIKDPVATFFDKVKSPYGHVLKTDPDGKSWQIWCGGLRNPYDFAFNGDGELFAYDSDMEWDLGLPWYRPTRVLHLVPGGEYGFREGSAKMPSYYPDTLPAVANIGLASPTGVKFGTEAKFPEIYQQALFILDWTYGRILAVWPRPQGASYANHLVGTQPYAEFVKGKGLPVTDLEFGKDGAMYFTVGGRGTQGGLYRVTWTGKLAAPDAAAVPAPTVTAETLSSAKTLREERHLLESILAGKGKVDLVSLWPKLGSAELGYTARLVLESLPEAQYQTKALAETNPAIAHTALLALARTAEKSQQAAILSAWAKLEIRGAADYRTPEISIARHGLPSPELAKTLLSRTNLSWSDSMTSEARATHREASVLRVLLNDPSLVVSLLSALGFPEKVASADPLVFGPQEEAIFYARLLSEVPATGFEPEQRKKFLSWFPWAKKLQGGNSFAKFLEAIRQRAMEKLPLTEAQKAEQAYQEALVAQTPKPSDPTDPAAPTRAFVKSWTLDELEPHLGSVKAGRNFAKGKEIFTSLLCSKCHQFHGAGGGVGPDLSGIGGRFAPKDILDAILEPNKVISEQYAAVVLETKTDSYLGLIASQTPETLTVYADPFGTTKVTIPVKDITKREQAKTSLMPMGLINNLKEEEILDLLAFLISGGEEKADNFKPTP